jgi:hypothetical protein
MLFSNTEPLHKCILQHWNSTQMHPAALKPYINSIMQHWIPTHMHPATLGLYSNSILNSESLQKCCPMPVHKCNHGTLNPYRIAVLQYGTPTQIQTCHTEPLCKGKSAIPNPNGNAKNLQHWILQYWVFCFKVTELYEVATCSQRSRRGLVQEDKRMAFVYTHGLFIT